VVAVTTEPESPDRDRPDPDRLTRLSELAMEIMEELEHLAQDSGNQFVSLAKRAQTNRRLITVTIISLIVDVVLSVFLGLGLYQVRANEHDISALTTRLDVSQTVQRQKALCPLYQLFLDMKTPAGRAAAPDPVKYDHSFQVIQDGYDALSCSDFITKGP
jgi:hypothetical protein